MERKKLCDLLRWVGIWFCSYLSWITLNFFMCPPSPFNGGEGKKYGGEILSLKCIFIPEGISVDITKIKFGVKSSRRYAIIVEDVETNIKDYLTNFTGAIVLAIDDEIEMFKESLEEEGKIIKHLIPVSAII